LLNSDGSFEKELGKLQITNLQKKVGIHPRGKMRKERRLWKKVDHQKGKEKLFMILDKQGRV